MVLAHFFKMENGFFVYDTNTNEILELDEVSWNIMRDILVNNLSLEQLNSRYPTNDVSSVLENIEELKKEGFFVNELDIPDFLPLSKKDIKRLLSSRLSTMLLEVTQQCNFRCKYCSFSGKYMSHRVHSNSMMSWKTAKKALILLHKHSSDVTDIHIGFYGGEPLLNFNLIKKTVEFSRNLFSGEYLHFSITTNGSLLSSRAILKFLVDNNFILHISFDGPQYIHDKWRVNKAGNGTYDLIIKNLKKLKDISEDYFRNNIALQAVITPPYDYKAVIEFFSTNPVVKDVSHIYLIPVEIEDLKVDPKSLFPEIEDKDAIRKNQKWLIDSLLKCVVNQDHSKQCEIIKSVFRRGLSKIHNRLIGPNAPVWFNGVCIPGFSRFFVSADGKIYVCEKVGQSFSIGDVNNGIDSDRVIKLISEYIRNSRGQCKTCWAFKLCELCYANYLIDDKFSEDKKRKYCNKMKKQIANNLKIYTMISKLDSDYLEELEE